MRRSSAPAKQRYAYDLMLAVVHRASWSGWGLRPKVRGDAPHRAGKGLQEVLCLSRCGVVQNMKAVPAECADHRRYERERVVIGPRFIRQRRMPIDHVNWMPKRRKTREQPFVSFGDSARAHAALKLLRGS
jgi:hypothetical protein